MSDDDKKTLAADKEAAPALDRPQLLRQLEYYFSDVAFPYDEFLASQADADGSVAAATLAGSPRLVSMTPNMSIEERAALLLELVAESDTVKAVGEARLGRVWPLPLEDPAAVRSVYLSGTPKDADEPALRAMLSGSSWAREFEPIVSIRRIRDVQRDRSYSGQLYVECEDAAKAQALVKAASRQACGVVCAKARLLREFFVRQDESIVEQRSKRAAKLAAGGGASGAKRPREAAETSRREEPAEDEATRKARMEAEAEAERKLVLRFEGAGPTASREAVEAVCKLVPNCQVRRQRDSHPSRCPSHRTFTFTPHPVTMRLTGGLCRLSARRRGGALPIQIGRRRGGLARSTLVLPCRAGRRDTDLAVSHRRGVGRILEGIQE